MPSFKEWDDHFKSLGPEELRRLNKAVNVMLDISPVMLGKQLYISSIAPSVRFALADKTVVCRECGSEYLRKWAPEDVRSVTTFFGKRTLCPDCLVRADANGDVKKGEEEVFKK
jgi:rubredoxin